MFDKILVGESFHNILIHEFIDPLPLILSCAIQYSWTKFSLKVSSPRGVMHEKLTSYGTKFSTFTSVVEKCIPLCSLQSWAFCQLHLGVYIILQHFRQFFIIFIRPVQMHLLIVFLVNFSHLKWNFLRNFPVIWNYIFVVSFEIIKWGVIYNDFMVA